MPHTIESEPWEYLPVLNECIKIQLTVLLGFIAGRLGALDAQVFVPQATQFVFKIALPFHVLRGIGIVVDFYDNSFLWSYIGCFLVLRAIALLASVIMALKAHGGIGQVAVNWLCLSWISTVILGVPISKAVFGDESVGLFLGLLAGISSFIFQLPLQLFLLECHTLERELVDGGEATNEVVLEGASSVLVDKESTEQIDVENVERTEKVRNDQPSREPSHEAILRKWLSFARRRDVWMRVARQLVWNPLLWGIFMGFFLSLSTLGPRYLKPTSDDFVPGLFFVWDTAAWLGGCVSPVSLVAMGVWMEGRSWWPLRSHISIVLFMLAKLFVTPMIMVGLSVVFQLNDQAGRAAILIATLPISLASFTLGSKYSIGQADLAANVAVGTLLLLPTVIIWNICLDAVGLYPIR